MHNILTVKLKLLECQILNIELFRDSDVFTKKKKKLKLASPPVSRHTKTSKGMQRLKRPQDAGVFWIFRNA